MGPLSGPMKSVKSLIDRRQEIEQQLHAIAMRQPPSQTVASPDRHLVIHAPLGFSAGAWMQKDQATSRSAARSFTDWKMCDFTSCHAESKPQPVHDKSKPFRKSGTAKVLPSKSASNPLISLGIFLGVCFSYRLGMETLPFLKK